MPEDQNTEWKEVWKDDYLAQLCGFANSQGGRLYVGVDDAGGAVGVERPGELLTRIAQQARNLLGIVVDVNLQQREGREVICIGVQPYHTLISLRGHYYYRSGNVNMELTGATLTELLLRRQGLTWDSLPEPNVRLSDLSAEALSAFVEMGKKEHRLPASADSHDRPTLLRNLGLLAPDSGLPTKAAVLLFHPEPESIYPGARVRLGYFEGQDERLAYHDEIAGPLILQPAKAFDTLLLKYLRLRIHYEGILRRETPPVPLQALREALHNALAHRNYADANDTHVAVSERSIAVDNPGALPPGLHSHDLFKKHQSLSPNGLIAQMFFRAGLIELWASGYSLINEAVRQAQLLRPDIKEAPGVSVRFYTSVREQLRQAGLAEENALQTMLKLCERGTSSADDLAEATRLPATLVGQALERLAPWLETATTTTGLKLFSPYGF